MGEGMDIREGGKGAGGGLLLRDEFLSQFDPDPEWEEPVPGRAAVLKLRGDKGALDIWTLYFATGNKGLVHANTREEEEMQVRRQRQHMRQQVTAHLRVKTQVLSILWGTSTGSRRARTAPRLMADCSTYTGPTPHPTKGMRSTGRPRCVGHTACTSYTSRTRRTRTLVVGPDSTGCTGTPMYRASWTRHCIVRRWAG